MLMDSSNEKKIQSLLFKSLLLSCSISNSGPCMYKVIIKYKSKVLKALRAERKCIPKDARVDLKEVKVFELALKK